jgi:hypothetical protein
MAEEWANDASRDSCANSLWLLAQCTLRWLRLTTDKERQLARQAVNSDAGQKRLQCLR